MKFYCPKLSKGKEMMTDTQNINKINTNSLLHSEPKMKLAPFIILFLVYVQQSLSNYTDKIL